LGLEAFGSFFYKQVASLACELSSFYQGLGPVTAEIDSVAGYLNFRGKRERMRMFDCYS
jgi:hypothetical protein